MKRALNASLRRSTGYELRRIGQRDYANAGAATAAGEGARDRLLEAPAFVFCTVRSGSTLLRVLLDSHSQICAPHELNLRDLSVTTKDEYAAKALDESRLDTAQLDYLVWDWVLHRELAASGKRQLVSKAPRNVFIADRIFECWPDARFIFLLRHPAAIARSRHALRPQDTEERNIRMVLRYADALEHARRTYAGLTVRYEDLAADPATVTQEVCDHLGLPWEPAMLDYGRFGHGRYRSGLGDWKEKIKSGRVQPPEPPPSPGEIPVALEPLCEAWGYTPADGVAAAKARAELHEH